jgi:hypothetical protein
MVESVSQTQCMDSRSKSCGLWKQGIEGYCRESLMDLSDHICKI